MPPLLILRCLSIFSARLRRGARCASPMVPCTRAIRIDAAATDDAADAMPIYSATPPIYAAFVTPYAFDANRLRHA